MAASNGIIKWDLNAPFVFLCTYIHIHVHDEDQNPDARIKTTRLLFGRYLSAFTPYDATCIQSRGEKSHRIGRPKNG